MRRARCSPVRPLALALLFVLAAPGAGGAFEFFDGRVQVHGFYEVQLRTIARNYSGSDDWDLTQWANVFNLEIEADIAPDGFGPFSLISAFSRVELRYDCVWKRGCGIFPSVDAFGDRAEKYPKRLFDGRRSGYVGTQFVDDTRKYRADPLELFRQAARDVPSGNRSPPNAISQTRGFFSFFLSPGQDQDLGTADDPANFVYSRYLGCQFGNRRLRGFEDGVGFFDLGPNDPGCKVEPIAALNNRPNPLRGEFIFDVEDFPGDPAPVFVPRQAVQGSAGDPNPVLGGEVGDLDLPFRQAPEVLPGQGGTTIPNGLWLPNANTRKLLRDNEIRDFDGNFSENALSWNHGQSQDDEYELKELYLDLEFLDGRMWLRVGKQSIVWGKTELFRNQDQFNPQDFGLSSLPGLEESRVSLWALRGVYSFYDVGPLEDVRIEAAMNFDQFEPADPGRCGEPYAVVLICSAYFGFMSHGLLELGLAGTNNTPEPWNDAKGIEFGGRLEFRWNRFSFALSNFYGYRDIPSIQKIFTFERNVDPVTGRPRRLNSRGRCETGSEVDCLQPGRDALLNTSVNQTLFHATCAGLIGFLPQDPSSCGNVIFNTPRIASPIFPLALNAIINAIVSGQAGEPGLFGRTPFAGQELYAQLAGFTNTTESQITAIKQRVVARNPALASHPQFDLSETQFDRVLVPLVNDGAAIEGPRATPIERFLRPGSNAFNYAAVVDNDYGLDVYLTDEQEALLGCGRFYATRCDIHGIDLMNAEASFLSQSFVSFEGTFGIRWDTTNASLVQPGTVGYAGGPVCTRFENGQVFVLPGCRGPRDPGYDPTVDGSTDGLDQRGDSYRRLHPFTGQEFRSEGAVLSFNLMMTLVGFSAAPLVDSDNVFGPREDPLVDEFDPDDPFRRNGCSFANPQFCNFFESFQRSLRAKRQTINAGGNGAFGRRDFQWHDGTPLLLDFEKSNVLGFSMDFAEDLTKTNWNMEMTWVNNFDQVDNDEFDGTRNVDTWNMTISVDRPTFVNFLNANRTFLLNGQLFIQYVDGFQPGFTSNGPWNFLGTFTVTTGYFQDRLLPQMTFVYDVQSVSAAFLPQVTYRFTENFSASFGMAIFTGGVQDKRPALNPVASLNRVGRRAYKDFAENGLSAVRDRDELFLRIRYAF